ncbi:MAG: hypothetical protein K2J99_07195 [Lachnospiraceae bacterium]|nr:hypothetical protein [Lachnospiraceae bacterium]
MEIVKRRKIPIKSWCILAGLLIFFLGMLAVCGVGVYNDSEQYITMHIHREPLYPLFLAFFRKICGDGYLTVAAAVQGMLAAAGIWILTEYLTVHFKLRIWEELIIVFLHLVPHLITKYVSALNIFLENSVMSEALCIPLFYIFLYFLLRMLFEHRRRDVVLCLLFAFLLSMTRGQMMSTILMWMVLLLLKMILEKKYRALIFPVIAVAAVFGLRSLTVHVYNYAVTGYFMGNTYGQINTLTNVIYACDEEDGEVFDEGSLERKFFEQFYAKADAMGLNYKYGGDTLTQRAEHLEEYHDQLKFEVLEADLSAYYFSLGEIDYYEQSSMSDVMAGGMLKKLLPVCFGQWLYDYILLCTNGFIRSIAVVHPLINWIAVLFYAAAVLLVVWHIWRGKRYSAAWMMGTALLFIAANVCATSITIMCLSRYMIYGFSLFYTALFLSVRELKIKQNEV